MSGWKRLLRLPLFLRRWMNMVRAALHQWFQPRRRSLPLRLALPPVRRGRRVILKLEPLEAIEAPDNLLALTAPLGAAAPVHIAQPSSQTPDVEKPSTIADAAMDSPTEEAKTLSDGVFSQLMAQPSPSVDTVRFLANAEQLSDEDTEPKHTANDPALDPVMATGDTLIDPLSHADAASADGAKPGSHHAGPPAGNGNPPNLAGANAGAGQGPGAPSTPFTGGSGGSSGGGGGGPIGGNLATRANQGAFANAAGTTVATQTAALPQTPTANVAPATAAIATPLTQTAPENTPSRNTLTSSVLSSTVQSGPVPFTVYNTGVDDSGTPLAAGSADPHYQITATPSPYAPGNAYVTQPTSYPFTYSNPWQPNGDGLSQWIGPVADEQNDPSGQYTYQTTFDLTGYDSSTAGIVGQYSTDDWLDEIDLNGQPVATLPHTANEFTSWQTLPALTSGFVPGVNTLDFVTENEAGSGGNPTGFRVELQGTADALQWQGPAFSWTQTPAVHPSVSSPGAQTNIEGDSVSLQVSASDPNGNPLSYDAVNLPPGLSINSSTGLISGTVQYGAAADFDGSYNPTILVANNQGGSTQTTFSWTINQAQVAPTLTSPPSDQTSLHGDNVSLQINASQVDNDPLTYDASNLPPGLSIDADTGLISGAVDPSATPGVPYAVTVTVTDGATNLTTSQTFNWTVSAANVAPVLTNPGGQSNAAGDEVSLQLPAADADGNPLTYTASGLPPGLTLDPVAGLISGTLPNSAASGTPYSVTVLVSNGTSSSNQTFSWTVNPISLQNPGDQVNLDGDSVSLQMSATDASNGTLRYSSTGLPTGLSIDSGSGLISGTLSNTADSSSPYSVTVTATDGTNSASQSFNWTVAKLALDPPDNQQSQEGATVSLQLSATDAGGTPTYSASGLPDGVSINSTTGLISGTIGVAAHGSSPYQVTVTATDGSNTSSQSFVWTVTPRVALVNPGPQSNASGDSVSLQLSATSPGGTMSYSAAGLPDGVSIDSSTGLISGTLAADAVSATPYTVTVTANDGTSSSSQTFSWTVSAINLMSPGDQSNLDGDTVSLPLTTSYHGTGTLSYTATDLPPGLSISSTSGQITGSVSSTADTDGPYQVTVTATDGTNTTSQTFNWAVNPLVSVDPIDDQSNADGDSGSLQVSASDALNNALTYSATGLPPGVSIDSTTGLISGTISTGADTNSPYAVTVTASDGAVSASQTFTWAVTAVGLASPGPQSSVDGQAVSLALQGSSGSTYTATGLPSGLSINGSTGLISGTLASNADENSPYSVTVTATLGTNSVSQTFLWTVTPVGLIAPSDQTNTEGDSVSLQLQGLSNGGSLTYSASGLPDGLSLNPTTGLITGTIAAGAAADGPFAVDVAVSNGTVSASQTFTWTVNPIVTLTAPDDQSNNEGDSVSLQVTATDSNNATLTYSADGLPAGLSVNSTTGLITGTMAAGDAANGPYAVTVTATDGTYSNSVTFNWNVTHTDTATPTMTNPGPQTNVAGDSVSLQINASDADGDALTYSATGLPDGLDIDPFAGVISGTVADDAVSTAPYQVTVTADDGNGQTVSQTFIWLINAPALSVQASPASPVEGNDTGEIAVATFITPNLNSQAGDFTATINWGDGNSDTGTVNGGNGSFTVTGDHVYAETGSYPITVQISDGVTGGSVTASTTATVTAAPLSATGGFDLGALEGQSANLTLAAFTSGNPSATASDFTATIDWGDGSGALDATVSDSGDGMFSVSGSHTYAQDGTYTATITITGTDGATASATSTVTVGDVYAGIPSNLTVASFTDTDTSVPASSFTVTINWGDGTQSSSGTVTGGNGTFTVQGTHTYAQDSIDQSGGVYPVSVTITDSSGDTLTANGTVTVVRPPLTLDTGNVETSPNSLTLSNVQVAAFTVPDGVDASSEFSASIDWGDNSTSAGTIQEVTPGLFEVIGSHTYATAGPYSIMVTVSQGWGTQVTVAQRPLAGQAGAPPEIEGPSVVPGMTQYQYTLRNVPAGATIQWMGAAKGNTPTTVVKFGAKATNVTIIAMVNGKKDTKTVTVVGVTEGGRFTSAGESMKKGKSANYSARNDAMFFNDNTTTVDQVKNNTPANFVISVPGEGNQFNKFTFMKKSVLPLDPEIKKLLQPAESAVYISTLPPPGQKGVNISAIYSQVMAKLGTPIGKGNTINQIQVGLIQNFTEKGSASYKGQAGTRNLTIAGRSPGNLNTLDVTLAKNWPWYLGLKSANAGPWTPQVGGKTSHPFNFSDNPTVLIPKFWNGNPLQSASVTETYHIMLAAKALDVTDEDDINNYFAMYEATWKVQIMYDVNWINAGNPTGTRISVTLVNDWAPVVTSLPLVVDILPSGVLNGASNQSQSLTAPFLTWTPPNPK